MAWRSDSAVKQSLEKAPTDFSGLDIYVVSQHIGALFTAEKLDDASTCISDMVRKAWSSGASPELKLSIFRLLKPKYIQALYVDPEQSLYRAITDKTDKLLGQLEKKSGTIAAKDVVDASVGITSTVSSNVMDLLRNELVISGLRTLDTDSSGAISYDEFSAFLVQKVPELPKEHHGVLFQHFDTNQDGTINVQELLSVLSNTQEIARGYLGKADVVIHDHTVREAATSTSFGHTLMTKYQTLKLMRRLGTKEFLISSQYYGDEYTVETQFPEFLAAYDPRLLEGTFIGFAPAGRDAASVKYMEKYLKVMEDCGIPNVFLDVNLVDTMDGTAPHMKGSLLEASRANADLVLRAVHRIDDHFRKLGYPDNPWRKSPTAEYARGELYVNFINVLDWLQLKPATMPGGERAKRLGEMFTMLYQDRVFQRRVTAVLIEEGHGLSVPGDFKNTMKWLREFFPADAKVPGKPNGPGLLGGYRSMLHCHASHTGHEHVSTLEFIEAGGDGIWAGFIPDAAQFGHNNIFVFMENMLRFGNQNVWNNWHLEQAIEVARHVYFLNFNTVNVPASYHIWGSAVRSEANTFFRTVADQGWRRRSTTCYHRWSEAENAELEKDRGHIALNYEAQRNHERDAMNDEWVGGIDDRWRRLREGDYHIAPLMGNNPTIHRRLKELDLEPPPTKPDAMGVPENSLAPKLKQLGFAVMVADLRANFNDPGFLQRAVSWIEDPPTSAPAFFQATAVPTPWATPWMGSPQQAATPAEGFFGWRYVDPAGNVLKTSEFPSQSKPSLLEACPVGPLWTTHRMRQERAKDGPVRKVRIFENAMTGSYGIHWRDVWQECDKLAKLEHPNIQGILSMKPDKYDIEAPFILVVMDLEGLLRSAEDVIAARYSMVPNAVVRLGKQVMGALEYIHAQDTTTFTVEMDRSDGQWRYYHWPPIVCDDKSCPFTLTITALNEPARAWNLAHGDRALQLGQRVVGINDVGLGAVQLRKELNSAAKLKLTIQAPGLRHGGINPRSIAIDANGDAKLELPLNNTITETQGRRDAITADSPYFSPERRQQSFFDGRDDVWAVGCVMAELLAGMPLEKLRDATPLPGNGSWDPLQACEEVYISQGMRLWLQDVLRVGMKQRPQVAMARETLELVPTEDRVVQVDITSASNVADKEAYVRCTCEVEGRPEQTLETDLVKVEAGAEVAWSFRGVLPDYRDGPVTFTVWASSGSRVMLSQAKGAVMDRLQGAAEKVSQQSLVTSVGRRWAPGFSVGEAVGAAARVAGSMVEEAAARLDSAPRSSAKDSSSSNTLFGDLLTDACLGGATVRPEDFRGGNELVLPLDKQGTLKVTLRQPSAAARDSRTKTTFRDMAAKVPKAEPTTPMGMGGQAKECCAMS